MATIAELQAAGLSFHPDEAIATVQQLICALRAPHSAPSTSHLAPREDNVLLNDDGSVRCVRCKENPTLAEVGILLHRLLPRAGLEVPGGLRHAIACALLNVDIAPREALARFSSDISRFEQGDRAALVRQVLARATASRTATVPAARMSRRKTMAAAAACFVMAIALITTGDRLRRDREPISTAEAPARSVPAIATAPPPAAMPSPARHATMRAVKRHPRPGTNLGRGIILVRDTPSLDLRGPAEPRSKGVMDRLKLGWLKRAFRSDL